MLVRDAKILIAEPKMHVKAAEQKETKEKLGGMVCKAVGRLRFDSAARGCQR